MRRPPVGPPDEVHELHLNNTIVGNMKQQCKCHRDPRLAAEHFIQWSDQFCMYLESYFQMTA